MVFHRQLKWLEEDTYNRKPEPKTYRKFPMANPVINWWDSFIFFLNSISLGGSRFCLYIFFLFMNCRPADTIKKKTKEREVYKYRKPCVSSVIIIHILKLIIRSVSRFIQMFRRLRFFISFLLSAEKDVSWS